MRPADNPKAPSARLSRTSVFILRHLFGGRFAGRETHDRDPDGSMRSERHDVEADAAGGERVQILAHARPLETEARRTGRRPCSRPADGRLPGTSGAGESPQLPVTSVVMPWSMSGLKHVHVVGGGQDEVRVAVDVHKTRRDDEPGGSHHLRRLDRPR